MERGTTRVLSQSPAAIRRRLYRAKQQLTVEQRQEIRLSSKLAARKRRDAMSPEARAKYRLKARLTTSKRREIIRQKRLEEAYTTDDIVPHKLQNMLTGQRGRSQGMTTPEIDEHSSVQELHRQKKRPGKLDETQDSPSVGFLCEDCGKLLSSKDLLELHMRKVHKTLKTKTCSNLNHPCNICGKNHPDWKSLHRHCLRSHTYEHGTMCYICNRTFNTLHTLLTHLKIHSMTPVVTNRHNCAYCTKVFGAPITRNKHHFLAHPDLYLAHRPFHCIVCFNHFQTEELRDVHYDGHLRFKCPICSLHMISQTSYDNHVKGHSRPGSTVGRRKQNKRLANIEKRLMKVGDPIVPTEEAVAVSSSEEAIRRFRLGKGNYVLSRQRGVADEFLSHLDTSIDMFERATLEIEQPPRPIPTKEVPVASGDSIPQRGLHVSMVIPQLPFKCIHCSSQFRTEVDIVTHLSKLHSLTSEDGQVDMASYQNPDYSDETSAPRFRCDDCDMLLKTPGEVIKHQKVAHGINPGRDDFPFKCDSCARRFLYQGSLDRHKQIIHNESEEAPDWSNPDQDLSLSPPVTAEQRLDEDGPGTQTTTSNQDTVVVPLRCDLCPRLFISQTYLDYHKGTQHPLEGAPLLSTPIGPDLSQSDDRDESGDNTGSTCDCVICAPEIPRSPGWMDIEKPHKCPHCPQMFRATESLESHIRLHHVELQEPPAAVDFQVDDDDDWMTEDPLEDPLAGILSNVDVPLVESSDDGTLFPVVPKEEDGSGFDLATDPLENLKESTERGIKPYSFYNRKYTTVVDVKRRVLKSAYRGMPQKMKQRIKVLPFAVVVVEKLKMHPSKPARIKVRRIGEERASKVPPPITSSVQSEAENPNSPEDLGEDGNFEGDPPGVKIQRTDLETDVRKTTIGNVEKRNQLPLPLREEMTSTRSGRITHSSIKTSQIESADKNESEDLNKSDDYDWSPPVEEEPMGKSRKRKNPAAANPMPEKVGKVKWSRRIEPPVETNVELEPGELLEIPSTNPDEDPDDSSSGSGEIESSEKKKNRSGIIDEANEDFPCNFCNQKFISKSRKRGHMLRHHPDKRQLRCTICSKEFQTYASLYTHRKKEHKSLFQTCKLCKQRFPPSVNMSAHIEISHRGNPRPYKCEDCAQCFRAPKALDLHRLRIHGVVRDETVSVPVRKVTVDITSKYPCGICEIVVTGRKRYNRHLRLHVDHLRQAGDENPHWTYLCDFVDCHSMIRRKDLFVRHLESHGHFTPLSCTLCDKFFGEQVNLDRHKEVVHGGTSLNKVWDCPYCIETFGEEEKFQEHHELHKVDLTLPLTGDFICESCGKDLVDLRSLNRHNEIYHVPLPPLTTPDMKKPVSKPKRRKTISCPVCSEEFQPKSLASFEAHMDTAHVYEHGLVCFVCTIRFLTYAQLIRHLNREHNNGHNNDLDNDEQPVKIPSVKIRAWHHWKKTKAVCKYCDTVLPREIHKHYYEDHHDQYVREVEFICDLCYAPAVSSQDLATHRLTHDKLKCTLCNKQFFKQAYFRTHMMSHTGERPFACSSCDKRFTSIFNLRDHEKRHQKNFKVTCPICPANSVGFYRQCHLDQHLKNVHGEGTEFGQPETERRRRKLRL